MEQLGCRGIRLCGEAWTGDLHQPQVVVGRHVKSPIGYFGEGQAGFSDLFVQHLDDDGHGCGAESQAE